MRLGLGLSLLLVTLCGVFTVRADSPARFERLLSEHADSHVNNAERFEVWHDKVSGQEFTCVFSGSGDFGSRPVSCFPTGRNWK